jgi:hypothetical protein
MVFCCLDFYFYFKILQLYYYIMVASFFASCDSPLENVYRDHPIPSGDCSKDYSIPSGTRSEGTGKPRRKFFLFSSVANTLRGIFRWGCQNPLTPFS